MSKENPKHYKVIALSCSGARKMFKSGDVVSDKDFATGVAEDLVKRKFLKALPKKESDAINKKNAEEREAARKGAEARAKEIEENAVLAAEKRKEINEATAVLNTARGEAASASKDDAAAKEAVEMAEAAFTDAKNAWDAADQNGKADAKKAMEAAQKNVENAKETQSKTAEALEAANVKANEAKAAVDVLTNPEAAE